MPKSLKKTLPTSSVAVLKYHSHLTHICCLSICPIFLQYYTFNNSRMYSKSWTIHIISKLSTNEIISRNVWLFRLEQNTWNPTPNMLLEMSLPNKPHCYDTLDKQAPKKSVYNIWISLPLHCHVHYQQMLHTSLVPSLSTTKFAVADLWKQHLPQHIQFIIYNTTICTTHCNLCSDLTFRCWNFLLNFSTPRI
jgi:hypothetical protein